MKRSLLTLITMPAVLLFSTQATALAAGPAAGHRACVALASPAGAVAPAVTCYATFAQSIRAATGGRVRLLAGAAAGSVTPDQLDAGPLAPDALFVTAIDYQNVNFSGMTLTWTQTAKCGSFQAASMPAGWNDVISSVQAFSGCATTLYANNNFGTPSFSIGKNGSAASLGSFNDKASSQKWCPAAPCG